MVKLGNEFVHSFMRSDEKPFTTSIGLFIRTQKRFDITTKHSQISICAATKVLNSIIKFTKLFQAEHLRSVIFHFIYTIYSEKFLEKTFVKFLYIFKFY